jgi:hypothetical protein
VTYFYSAYGLTLTSDSAIPAFRKAHKQLKRPDLVLSFGPEPQWVRDALRLPCKASRKTATQDEGDISPFTLTSFGASEFFQLAYEDGARFIVDGAAKRLWGQYLPPHTFEDAATYLIGPVMGFVLRRRGVMALHASSVCIGGNAVVLCGSSGSGKSMTAAALAVRGVPVLAEDISPVIEKKGLLYVQPGHLQVCLWPDAVASLFGAAGALPQLTPNWEKCSLVLDGVRAKFQAEKRPVGIIYLFRPRVHDADAPRIEDSGMRDALLELVQNTYMNWLLDRGQRAAELDDLTRLVRTVAVRTIVPHADPARIGKLCELISRDVERLPERQPWSAVDSRP